MIKVCKDTADIRGSMATIMQDMNTILSAIKKTAKVDTRYAMMLMFLTAYTDSQEALEGISTKKLNKIMRLTDAALKRYKEIINE